MSPRPRDLHLISNTKFSCASYNARKIRQSLIECLNCTRVYAVHFKDNKRIASRSDSEDEHCSAILSMISLMDIHTEDYHETPQKHVSRKECRLRFIEYDTSLVSSTIN